MWRVVAGLVVLSVQAFAWQYTFVPDVATGDILVATEKLTDENFEKSVVLLVQHDADEGTVGLIVNRRTEMTLSKAFPKVHHANADPVYLGGPVEITAVLALVRLPQKAEKTTPVAADIYVTGAKELIEKSIASHTESSRFRIYVGYAGWAADQLKREIQVGAWLVLHRRSNLAFDDDPDSLWSRLNRDSHSQMAEVVTMPLLRPFERAR